MQTHEGGSEKCDVVKKERKGRSDGLESRTKRRRKRGDGDEDENVEGSRKEKKNRA